jgi:hypothetical protein
MERKFKNTVQINKKETEDGKVFYYFDIEIDYKKYTRVWINKEMTDIIAEKYGKLYIEFPIRNGEITKGKKENSLILRKGTKNVFFLETDQEEGSLRIEKIKSHPSNNFSILAQQVSLDAIRTFLITTNDEELILDYTYIYTKRNRRKEKKGILKINTNKNKLLIEDISINTLNEIIKELE